MSHEGRLGPRKLRQAEAAVGEKLWRAMSWWPEVECITPDDRHFRWNRKTGEVRRVENPTHYNTCVSERVSS